MSNSIESHQKSPGLENVTVMATSPAIEEAESAPLKLTAEQVLKLRTTSRILHLLHHRNYNQHRRQHWYPYFSTFRRQLNHLIHDITIIQSPKSLPSELLPSRRREIVKMCEQKVEKRLKLWRTTILRKWFGSFSQLVGDNQFAVLGLVLLGCLGRACGITGVTEQMIEEGDDIGVELREFTEGQEVKPLLKNSESDIGIPIARNGNKDREMLVIRETDDRLIKGESDILPRFGEGSMAKNLRKKARRKTAIDDLFSGLV
ncbi:hypothetical protein FKW77_010446 [Venturia effusa]|uniref:RNase MRP protein 1 RNA binding domain-containing protein n=1 Tax=Venturia effusa TaxID=50376 RepID=A0A517L4M9_9PEZI|nr:hypothetical protein FKW77_010446 [Venturia effusa]